MAIWPSAGSAITIHPLGNALSVGLEHVKTATTTASNARRQFATPAMGATARYMGLGCRGARMMMKSLPMEGTRELNGRRHCKRKKTGEVLQHLPVVQRTKNTRRRVEDRYNCIMRNCECGGNGGPQRRAKKWRIQEDASRLVRFGKEADRNVEQGAPPSEGLAFLARTCVETASGNGATQYKDAKRIGKECCSPKLRRCSSRKG